LIAVRVAEQGDAALVDLVLQESYPALMAGAYEPDLLARALPMMVRSNPRLLASGSFYLAESGGEPVGCGGWTFDEPGSGILESGTAHIRHFGVRPGWTGKGAGRLLYERCEADARAAGAKRFLCLSSLNGEPFYRALGFNADGAVDIQMGPDVSLPSVVMSRPI
jgi:N-acetylglutamate synthase-like GNAT family acetyltransferase